MEAQKSLPTNFPVLVVGTGAMATLFAFQLAEHYPVSILGTWREALQTMANQGVTLEQNGDVSQRGVAVYSDPKQFSGVQLALILVKSWQTARTAEQLTVCLADDGIALSLQNGLGNLEILQSVLGADRSALGVTTLGATSTGPARVRLGGEGEIYLPQDPRLHNFAALFQAAGFEVQWTEDLQAAVWGKLVINSAINPLTALIGCRNGSLLELDDACWLLDEVAEETAQFATSQGIGLPFTNAVESVREVARRSALNVSSMLADLRRGAPTEIDMINGAITQRAAAAGYLTPLNHFLWKTVRARAAYLEQGG